MFPDSNSKTTNYIVTEVEKIGILKKGTKENKTLEELMFPDDCFGKTNEASEEVNLKNNCTADKVNEVDYNSETQEPILKRKRSKAASVLEWDDSVSNAPEGNLTCPKPNCSYETYQKRYLDLHIKGHHDCPYCDKLFFGNNAKRSLGSHLRVVHGAQTEDFKCQACKKTVMSKGVLLRHQKENCAGFPFRDTRKFSDIKDPLFIMPKPPI